ncbi:MAG: hypothetical protein KC912_10235 [Proteobacteria bacterium]|nr:hypothetical protein [Pseudomonadota bacterium]
MLLLLSLAIAAEPIVEIEDDSWISADIVLAAPIDKVAAVLSNPEEIGRIDGTVTVTAKPDEACMLTRTVVDHPIASVAYDSRVCPEGDGVWHAQLADDGLRSFESIWTVTEVSGGTRMQYRVRTQTNLMVPQWIINRSSAKSVAHTFEKLRDHLEAS